MPVRATVRTRSLASATLAALPRLTDTRDELLAISRSLGVDANASVYLGLEARESRVKSMSLDQVDVLAFATHGLTPGDLDGLHQSALALSSPALTGEQDVDGLLVVAEILGLDLDAEWVVLSACNTADEDGHRAEGISGLVRAFFYAGARSLLVTHWSIESTSARVLTTEIFRVLSESPRLSRAEALQRAQVMMIDEARLVDGAGQVRHSYAHPAFWGAFMLVGDRGR